MKPEPNIPEKLFATHGKEIEEIFRRAVRHALLIHKKLGNPIATWRNGKVVIVPPEEIPIDESDDEIDYEFAKKAFAFVHGEQSLNRLK